MAPKQEFLVALITISTTAISANIIVDALIGILTYTSARLFYHYFGEKIKFIIDNFKLKTKSKYKRILLKIKKK